MIFALMFNVLEGGVSEPIKWSKENLTTDRSIIILDESNQTVWVFQGSKQGLIAKRTALRQAESLKGHGYAMGKSIIGRDLKTIKEIDQRKIGREPETDKLNLELQELLNKKYKEMDNLIISFGAEESVDIKPKFEPKSIPKPEAKPEIKPISKLETIPKSEPKPVPKPELKTIAKSESPKMSKPEVKPVIEKPAIPIKTPVAASEYDVEAEPKEPTKIDESESVREEIKVIQETPIEESKVAFVIKAVLDYFNDIWVSKKNDGSYAIEMIDGPVCQFNVKEGAIKFSTNSFSSISTNLKSEIQKKFVELSKLDI
jgi:hypothetical protein